jgi:hypothetical protein
MTCDDNGMLPFSFDCVLCISAFRVVICRSGRVWVRLPGVPCGDDGVLFLVCVAQAP